jgi:predicted alpha/beta-hydrolase family hydrolase
VSEIKTPHGLARAHVRPGTTGALILGHGAGGGIAARDLTTAAGVAESEGLTVVLVEQPYRVAGRRAPAPARQLDAAWLAVVEHPRDEGAVGPPLVVGGRSSGARVACRTAAATGAAGVLCLAFPLQPPGRANAPSRIDELDAVEVPTLVVQGEHDPFGMPPEASGRTVVRVVGTHSLATDLDAVGAAVKAWLQQLIG